MRKFSGASLAALGTMAAVHVSQAQQVGRAPIAIEVSTAPTAMVALGRVQLVYEVRLVNYGAERISLSQLDVLDPTGAKLGSWKDAQLAQRLASVGGKAAVAPQDLLEVLKLDPGMVKVAYLLVALKPGYIAPSSLHHQLIIATNNGSDTVKAKAVSPARKAMTRMIAPVSEGTWVAIRGPSNSSGHRLSIVVQAGEASIPQRYAVDWARLGSDGKLFKGDSTKLANWYGYGLPVSAGAEGRVVSVQDGVGELAPFALSVPAIIEAKDAVGNYVIVDVGGGGYATYAHLKPGSVRAKAGDRVTAGQVLGEIGNSGNSLAPHLHFHISDAPGILAGEGLPFLLNSFELLGRVNSSGSLLAGIPWTPTAAQPSRAVVQETPLENMVVRFRR